MAQDPEIELWLSEKKEPPQAAMRRVREVFLAADARVSEYLKYGTLSFGFEGDIAGFVQTNAKTVTLMFNRGARIAGKFAHLEGSGPTARFMRFKDLAEVEKRASELSKIVAAWCTMMAAGEQSARLKAKPVRAR